MTERSLLDMERNQLQEKLVSTKKVVDQRRANRGYVPWSGYLINFLTNELAAKFGVAQDDLDISLVERKKFNADIAVRVTSLLKSKPTPEYIQNDVPRFAAAVQPLIDQGILEKAETKGIYLNLRLSQRTLLSSLDEVQKLGLKFGEQDCAKDRSYMVDYSSPNAAKHLHAGHIRGTIIGHVLCNLYEASGAVAYRVNYLNEWGGLGEILTAYDELSAKAPSGVAGNDLLYCLYLAVRTLQKAGADKGSFEQLGNEDREILNKYFDGLANWESAKDTLVNFKERARLRFSKLEAGEKVEVELWKKIVAWSLEDFEKFYSLLGMHLDFLIGESFYVEIGKQIVREGLASGKVLHFTEELAAKSKSEVKQALDRKELTEAKAKTLLGEIDQDVGAYVVPLSGFERMVVQRRDGASIYATRDIAGVKHRSELFGATDFIYEVGQEQSDHFAKLFEVAEVLALCGARKPSFKHVYHGFYIDSKTKKKLSSREGAASVLSLFSDAIAYFAEKYRDSTELGESEKQDVAHKLAVGSVIYNDLKKEKKLPVEINPERRLMLEEFERSGGAYVMYSVCRAKSIIRRGGIEVPAVDTLGVVELAPIEVELIKLISDFPRRVWLAARSDNPAALVTAIEEMATLYNSYYHDYPVFKGGERNMHRLVITSAVAQVMENGLRILQIECPERI